jgi:2-polyprenyl-3-methyl-5-hydroxy-6-metoxy-1,4-benzoquinol methylase
MKSLISKCICGSNKFSIEFVKNQIPVKCCNNCGILHQNLNLTSQEYNDWYHQYDEYKRISNTTPYSERYEHDSKIAKLRIAKYQNILKEYFQFPILDIGAANNAFVDQCNQIHMPSIGIDIRNIVKNSTTFFQGNVLDLNFQTQLTNHLRSITSFNRFSIITLHDVLEHVIDPVEFIQTSSKLLKNQGIYIIDIPDFYHENGLHHWRQIEHLWFFTQDHMKKMLNSLNFKIHTIDYPIPGKVVFYAINQN